MKKLLLLFFILPAMAVYAADTSFTITKTQVFNMLMETRMQQQVFTIELDGFKSKTGYRLNQNGIEYVNDKQQKFIDKIKRIDWIDDVSGMYEYMPDDFKRELNYARNDNNQNYGLIRELINFTYPQNGSGFPVWIKDLIKNFLINQFPYLETIIEYFFK